MINLILLINIIGSFFATIIIYYYMKAIFRQSKVDRWIEISTYLIIMVFTSIISLNYPGTIIMPIVSFVLILISSLLYKGTVFLRILVSLILLALFILSEAIATVIILMLTGQSIEFISGYIIYYLQSIVISKLLVFTIVKIYEYKRNTSHTLVHQKILIPLVLMPISSILVIYIISEKAFIITNTYDALLIVIAISLLIAANIFIFYLFEKQLKQEQEKIKLEFFKEQLESQKKHFEELTENQRRINKAIHDTKNQLLAILGYIENSQNSIAIENLNSLCNNISGRQNFINTGNIAVDSLLNAKINRINGLNITLETSIFLEQNNQIEEIDLCVILGNLLDNAMEACESIPLAVERKIKLKIVQVDEYLSIEIRNSTFDKVEFNKGKIFTTKKDKLFHGFGLESIKEMVEKYNGHINYEQEEKTFTVRILLQNSIASPAL